MLLCPRMPKKQQGWFSSVPANGSKLLDWARSGQDVVDARDRLGFGDGSTDSWKRHPNDPSVVKLREYLQVSNGIQGLEVCTCTTEEDVDRAAALFHRDGFVAVRDVLTSTQLDAMRDATERAMDQILEHDPNGSFGGGAGSLPHRYSYGGCSATRHMLHEPAWCDLVDLPATTPLLRKIFGSTDKYAVCGAGGDVCLPGAIEYQPLHSDSIWADNFFDPHGKLQITDLPPPMVTINFCMVDMKTDNGPIRQIPGTHNRPEMPPPLDKEPAWMKTSTLCPLPAGSCIVRDNRCWHGNAKTWVEAKLRMRISLTSNLPLWPLYQAAPRTSLPKSEQYQMWSM